MVARWERSMHGRLDGRSLSTGRAEDLGARLTRWIAGVRLSLARRRERRHLSDLDQDQLADLGLTRFDVERECRRRPWDGSARRLRPPSARAYVERRA